MPTLGGSAATDVEDGSDDGAVDRVGEILGVTTERRDEGSEAGRVLGTRRPGLGDEPVTPLSVPTASVAAPLTDERTLHPRPRPHKLRPRPERRREEVDGDMAPKPSSLASAAKEAATSSGDSTADPDDESTLPSSIFAPSHGQGDGRHAPTAPPPSARALDAARRRARSSWSRDDARARGMRSREAALSMANQKGRHWSTV